MVGLRLSQREIGRRRARFFRRQAAAGAAFLTFLTLATGFSFAGLAAFGALGAFSALGCFFLAFFALGAGSASSSTRASAAWLSSSRTLRKASRRGAGGSLRVRSSAAAPPGRGASRGAGAA